MKDRPAHLDAGVDARRQGLEGRAGSMKGMSRLLVIMSRPIGAWYWPRFQVADPGEVPEQKIALLKVELVGDVADFNLVGDWQEKDAISHGINAGAAHLDSGIETRELLAGDVRGAIHRELRADLAAHLELFEMENTVGVCALDLLPDLGQRIFQRRLLGQLEMESVPAFPGGISS